MAEEEPTKEELTKERILEILEKEGHLDSLAEHILEAARKKGITDADVLRKVLPPAGFIIYPFQGGS